MSVYNGQKYLPYAIHSIVNQTFSDFEFLIIDDGSNDESAKIVQSFRDARIRLVQNKQNLGLTRCLEKGLEMARGEYIARMDADDISLPQRLKKQVEYLEKNPDVSAVGCFWENIDTNGKRQGYTYVPTQKYMCSFMIFLLGEQPIGHPCATYRAEVITRVGGYRSKYLLAQDADLWFRLIAAGYKIANVPEILFLYRTHADQLSSRKMQIQDESHTMALASFLSEQLNRFVHPTEARLLRPTSFDDFHLYDNNQRERMLSLQEQTANIFFAQNNLSAVETVNCMFFLWKRFLYVSNSRIISFIQCLFIKTLFCVRILKSQIDRGGPFKCLSLALFLSAIQVYILKQIFRK